MLFRNCVLITFTVAFTLTSGSEDKTIVSARIESCASCQLKRLPQVRAFIYDDVPKYANVEWKKVPGAAPEVIFLNEADEEVERYPLDKLNRQECNELLLSKGLELKEDLAQEREL